MDLKVDASTEAQRQQDLHGQDRATYKVGLRNLTYDLVVGKVIKVTYPRFGLDLGKSFVITGFDEDSKDDSGSLTLWG